jgi:hypothetical protein
VSPIDRDSGPWFSPGPPGCLLSLTC